MGRLRSPVLWFGGKGNMVAKLLKYYRHSKYYAEPFFGGGSLFFAKPKSDFEVINDIDKDLMDFYRVLEDEDKFNEFYKKVVLTPYSRAIFYEARERFKNKEYKDDIEKAYLFFIIARMSFSGDFVGGWGFVVNSIHRQLPATVSRWLSTIDMLPEIHNRIMQAQIECLDFRNIFKNYISRWEYRDSFVYVDPPYIKSTRRSGGYRFEMSDKDHQDLVDLLIKYSDNAKFMLSGYENEIYERLERAGWKKICWDVGCFAVGRTYSSDLIGKGKVIQKQKRKECVWINYD